MLTTKQPMPQCHGHPHQREQFDPFDVSVTVSIKENKNLYDSLTASTSLV